MSFDAAVRRMRALLLAALVGDRAGERSAGLWPRAALAAATFALTVAVWLAARASGVLGTASLFFPATLFATLFTGWEFGLLLLAASAATIYSVARVWFPPQALLVFAGAGVIELSIAQFARSLLRSAWHSEQALQSRAEASAREAQARELVLGEARHRLKNLMTVIEALAKFSRPKAGEETNVDDYLARFLGRLRALGAASDLALRQGFDVLEANAICRAVLAPFLADPAPRLRFEGPPLRLSEQFGSALALALHELASNALKYGALSAPGGEVDFRWRESEETNGRRVLFEWRERGGPCPQAPSKEGFGHRLIRAAASGEPEGRVEIAYPPEGLVCRISWIKPSAPPALGTEA